MAWYEAQIVGVAIGGLLGIGTNVFITHYNNEKLKKSLLAGIRSEVVFLKKISDRSIKEFTDYKNEIEESGKIQNLYSYTGDFEFHFLDRNFDKIGVLDEKILTPLLALKQTTIALNSGLKTTIMTSRVPQDNKGLVPIHLSQIKQAIATFDQIKNYCNVILKN